MKKLLRVVGAVVVLGALVAIEVKEAGSKATAIGALQRAARGLGPVAISTGFYADLMFGKLSDVLARDVRIEKAKRQATVEMGLPLP